MSCPDTAGIVRVPVVAAVSGRGHFVRVQQIAEAIVDPALGVSEAVLGRSWHLNRPLGENHYVRSSPRRARGERKWVYLHRLVLGLTDPKVEGEHINGNTLDNRLCNLRPATRRQNTHNIRARSTRWPYKGIDYYSVLDAGAAHPRYRARIYVHGRQYQLGPFPTMEEAARAYNDLARDAFGEFAWLNTIVEETADAAA